mgnify:FL=1|jgi:hypothetical protein
MGSSKFSSPFFKRSPLQGAYRSGADAVFAVSDAEHFAKLQNDITAGTLATFTPEAMDEDLEKRIAKRKGRISQVPDITSNVEGATIDSYTPSKFAQLFGKEQTLDPDIVKKQQAKTKKLETRLTNRKANRATTTNEKLANNCIRQADTDYIGYDPDLNNGKGGCY